jgi:DNA topoisomerase-3
LKSPELTGLWEKKLRDIEHGTYKDKQFLDELIKQIYSIIDDVKKDSSEKKVSEGERSSKTKTSKGSPSYKKNKGKHIR